MGKGRAPCCDKSQVKKGPWSPAEDLRLITFIQKHGHENWRALPKQAGLLRCGKSCRLRWINYLRPDVKRGNFTKEEEDTIIKLHQTLGNKWSKIASHLPGRTDNEIKNVWNTHLKKRLTIKKKDSTGGSDSSTTSSSSSSSSTTNKRNTDTELDHPWKNIGLTSIKPPEEPNELLQSSSDSSNNSNITNYDQLDSLLDQFSPPNYNLLEEVNKPEIEDLPAAEVEIPLESDLEFWNMLDGLNSSLPMEIQLQNNDNNNNNNDDENKKWLRYLENELGLEAIDDGSCETTLSEDDAGVKPMSVPENCQFEMPVKPPEVNSDMGYYHLWPSL